MNKPQNMRLQYMKRLVDDLCIDSIRFSRHPLGDMGIADKLTRGIDVAIPDKLKQRASGIQEAIRTLGILTLGSLKRRFAQSKRDKPLQRRKGKKRRERMTAEEQELIGLVILWFGYIEPAIRSSKSLSDRKTINTARLGLKGLMEGCQLAAQCEMHLKWIIPLFLDMYEQGESGTRNAINYRERALAFLLRQIVENVAHAGLAVEDVLPDLAGNGPDAARAPAPMPDAATSSVVDGAALAATDGAAEWEARLGRCVADYRAYELGELERWLGERVLPPIADWFQIRRVCCLVDQAEREALVFLEDTCKPGQRTALLDHRGSGMTTALWWLSSQYCEDTAAVEPVVLRLDARDYVRSAAGESPYRFLARQIYGSSRDSQEKRQVFEDVLSETETICLVDNLAQLSPADQRIIGRRLWNPSGLVLNAQAGSSDELLVEIGGEDVVQAELTPLEKAQIWSIIQRFADRCGADFDVDLAHHIAQRELPKTGQFPLGLELICKQVLAHRSDCASIIERLINDLVESDEKLVLRGDMKVSTIPPLIGALALLAWHIYPTCEEQEAGKEVPLEVGEEQVQRYLQRPGGEAYPLLIPTGPGTWRFFNQEVLSYLVAIEDWRGYAASRCEWTSIPDIFKHDILAVTNRHHLALCERELNKENQARVR